jgi:hypothetical protein
MEYYVKFNLFEGSFWIALGLLCFYLAKKVPEKFRTLAIFSACNLVLFGISDLVESQVGSFLESGMEWLYVWKILGVIGLVSSIVWYVVLRTRHETKQLHEETDWGKPVGKELW